MSEKILIVDDEPNITASFSLLLRDDGYRTDTAASVEEASKKLKRNSISLVLLDLNLPGKSGIDFLRDLKRFPSAPLVLVISGQSDIPTAVEAVRLGAIDYLEKPVRPEKLIASVKSAMLLAQANRQRNVMIDELDTTAQITGQSRAVNELLSIIGRVAPTDSTVLITGENGTGKELAATRIYLQSNRRDKPYVKVNCPGIPETLFESELFGHTKGAFTGAVKNYPGKFRLADSGTIFLDEIGDLPMGCQAKLLRVLETGEVETLGSENHNKVNVRVICATNQNLRKLVSKGKFREDLYYRISVLVVDVPPLRDRPDDVPLLAGEFLKRFDPSGATHLSPEAMASLAGFDYPGNVRQLKNLIERLTILFAGVTVQPEDISAQFEKTGKHDTSSASSLTDKTRLFEQQLIQQALKDCNGNISAAARILGVDRANLSRKIKELGLKNT